MATGKILVCDDEPHILHVVATKLKNAGYEVATALDGEEGWQMACEAPPDLIITDYQMPVLSGLELCARLRADEGLKSIPVLMLTARGFSLRGREREHENIRRLVVKPFSPREVLRCVEELLGCGKELRIANSE